VIYSEDETQVSTFTANFESDKIQKFINDYEHKETTTLPKIAMGFIFERLRIRFINLKIKFICLLFSVLYFGGLMLFQTS
jgi:hypothetical protein